MNRSTRAILWTTGIGIALIIPITYRVWLEYGSGPVARNTLGMVQPFVYRDTLDQPITKEVLTRAVTVVLNVPKLENSNSPKIQENIELTSTWIRENLSIHHAEEKNPLILIATGNGVPTMPSEWRIVSETPTPGTLLPENYSPKKPWLVLIDPNLSFAGVWPLDQMLSMEEIEKTLSRTTFEQYLGNYLARRTFMGPRRESSK